MRLIEFYNPEFDEFSKRNAEDTHPKMTLETPKPERLEKLKELKNWNMQSSKVI